MCEKCFPIVFLLRWTPENSTVLKFERCKWRDDNSVLLEIKKV